MHVYGLPFHLWSRENLKVIGNYLGEIAAVKPHTLDLSKPDGARILVKFSGRIVHFEPVEVTDGVKNYKFVFFPMILENEVNVGVERTKWVAVMTQQKKK